MELNIQEYVDKELEKIKNRFNDIKLFGHLPKLTILTDEKDFASESYMKSKINLANKLGITCEKQKVENVKDLMFFVNKAERNNDGIILQLPFQNRNVVDMYKALSPKNDMDGFFSYQQISVGNYVNAPCTSRGMFDYMKYWCKSLRGKTVCLVGRGELTNKPLSLMLVNEGATVIVLTSKSDLEFRKLALKQADIVVCATSIKGSVSNSELSDNKKVLVFNCGIVRDQSGKLDTELNIDVIKDNVDYTPRIKGVGLLTTMCLYKNLANHYECSGEC